MAGVFATDATLPVRTLPPVAGLGSFGIDVGVDLRRGDGDAAPAVITASRGACAPEASAPPHILRGPAWRALTSHLSEQERQASTAAHPAIGVCALHAATRGTQLRAWTPGEHPQHLVIPIDTSAAVSDVSPLAPIPGACDFDSTLVAAMQAWDIMTLAEASARASHFAADLSLFDATRGLMNEEELWFEPHSSDSHSGVFRGVRIVRTTLNGEWHTL